ncbi:hypothetical protein F5Y03DRAFT_400825 [Xylaria venustula]|nr:hypothetical protein F5Y03DRAFT_400825 [Xylaria venustula]
MPKLPESPSSQRSFEGSPRSHIPVPRTKRDSSFRKHAALNQDITLTPEEWFNVNRRIIKTVDIILSYGHLIQGPGPHTYELHAHLGVALVAEIIVRPIQRPCSLADPRLQRSIKEMAADPRHPEFRHTYPGGKIWFSFSILDPEIAEQPLIDDYSASN